MPRLHFSNTANQLQLSASIVSSDTVLPLNIPPVGWPATTPFKAVIAPDTSTAEVVLVTIAGPTSFTVTRAQDGTSASNFSAGTTVEHRWSAAEADEANAHVNATSGVHGLASAPVGVSDAQTLSNKTLVGTVVQSAVHEATATEPAVKGVAAPTGSANVLELSNSDQSNVLASVDNVGNFRTDGTATVGGGLDLAGDATVGGLLTVSGAAVVTGSVTGAGVASTAPDVATPAVQAKAVSGMTAPLVRFRSELDADLWTLGSDGNARLVTSPAAGTPGLALVGPETGQLPVMSVVSATSSEQRVQLMADGSVNAKALTITAPASTTALTVGGLTVDDAGKVTSAPNVVTFLGVAVVTATQDNITAEADLTGLSVTVTVPAGRRLRLRAYAVASCASPDKRCFVRIKEGATILTTAVENCGYTNVASATLEPSAIITPTEGAHTYKVTMQNATSADAMKLNASSDSPAYLVVEDLGSAA